MCGIFGFTDFKNNNSLFPTLAEEMSKRGSTSWGVTNGAILLREMGDITDTIKNTFRKWDNSKGVIFHTRAPSGGTARDISAAHPFTYSIEVPMEVGNLRYRTITGIHNGYVATHPILKNKYPDRKDFNVDSQHLFKHILDGNDLDEITGSGVVAYYESIWDINKDTTEDTLVSNRLFLTRFDSDNLHIARLDDQQLIFASTKSSIEKAARLADAGILEYLSTKDRHKYEIVMGDVPQLVELEPMLFGKSTNNAQSYADYFINGRYIAAGSNFPGAVSNGTISEKLKKYINEDVNKCGGCEATINPETQAICDACFAFWINGDKQNNVLTLQ